MAHKHSDPSSAVTTSEELGVLLMKAILSSALANKITSADGKSLVVPFAITITPVSSAGGVGSLETVDCHSACWKILGQPVICVTKCVTTYPQVAPGDAPDDQTLRGLVTPGPPLRDPAVVEKGLAKSLLQVGTPMEAGILLMNSVMTSLAQRTDLVRADGSAQLTGVATVSLPQLASGPTPTDYSSQCTETCLSILNHDVLCFQECHGHAE